MATFSYKAIDDRGKQKKGTTEADSARLLRQQLRASGLIPLEVEAVSNKSSKSGASLFSQRIKTADLALITRQLSTLVASAIPIEECLHAVAEQCDKPKIKAMKYILKSSFIYM